MKCIAVLAGLAALATLSVPLNAATPEKVIVIEGHRDAGEAGVTAKALKYFPFDVPEGVTSIRIHKELTGGPGDDKGTVDHGLFDPRGYGPGGPGFRGWMGGAGDDIVLNGDPDGSQWFLGGPIPAGTWNLAQSFLRSAPNGLTYKYTITLGFDGPKPPEKMPPVPAYKPGVLNPKPGWYAGNLHNHTIHSDGRKTLDEVVAMNKAAGYQFMAGTDHNTPRHHWDFARAGKEYPDMLLLFGEEFTSPGGHANIIGMHPGSWFDFRIDPGDGRLPGIIREAHRQGALFSANHPFSLCTSCFWRYPVEEYRDADTIEVWNGSWGQDDRKAVDLWDSFLKAGRKIGAVGGSDYHRDPDPLMPATIVHARNLSQPAVLDALKGGHAILAESPAGPFIYLSAGNGKIYPGDTAKAAKNGTLPVRIQVKGGKGDQLRLVWATGETKQTVDGDDVTTTFTAPKGARYIRAELIKPNDDNAALTNPIYIGK